MKLPKLITQEEFEKVLKAEKKGIYRVAFLLGFEAGMRLSEIAGHTDRRDKSKNVYEVNGKKYKVPPLTADRVDEVSIKIISGKGGKDRVVPRPKRFSEKAKAYLPVKVSRRMLQYEFSNMTYKVLGRRLNFHVLRHGFCSHLVNQGRPLHEVQMLAGHSRLDTTGIYLHANPKEAIDKAREVF